MSTAAATPAVFAVVGWAVGAGTGFVWAWWITGDLEGAR